MARRDKQARRSHRQRKKQEKQRAHAQVPSGASQAVGVTPTPPESPSRRVLKYEITDQPLPETSTGGRRIDDVLEEEARNGLFEEIHASPRTAAGKLERLVEVHPDVPTLYNWLANCYARVGDHANAARVVQLNYQRNPGYLFARTDFAELCLTAGQPDMAATVMDGKFDLKALYPTRNVFHVTEFVAVMALSIRYAVQAGHRENAQKSLDLLKETVSNPELVERLDRLVNGSPVAKALQGASPFAAPKGPLGSVFDDD